MENRLRDVIDSLALSELYKIKNDIDNGSVHIGKLIEKKINEKEFKHYTYCSVCQQKLDPYSTDNFTLIFGPLDFRKKASFCAIDCLEYFISNLKKIKKVV